MQSINHKKRNKIFIVIFAVYHLIQPTYQQALTLLLCAIHLPPEAVKKLNTAINIIAAV